MAKFPTGATGVRIEDVLDSSLAIDERLIEWTHEGRSNFAQLNGHSLEAREIGYARCHGFVDGEFVDGADNRPDVMVGLIGRVALRD